MVSPWYQNHLLENFAAYIIHRDHSECWDELSTLKLDLVSRASWSLGRFFWCCIISFQSDSELMRNEHSGDFFFVSREEIQKSRRIFGDKTNSRLVKISPRPSESIAWVGRNHAQFYQMLNGCYSLYLLFLCVGQHSTEVAFALRTSCPGFESLLSWDFFSYWLR